METRRNHVGLSIIMLNSPTTQHRRMHKELPEIAFGLHILLVSKVGKTFGNLLES